MASCWVTVAFAESVGFPLVAKPPAGAGALATYRLDDVGMLRSWLESMLPQDGSSVPLRSEPTSSSARLSAYVEALRPHKALFDAVRPLLERIAPKK